MTTLKTFTLDGKEISFNPVTTITAKETVVGWLNQENENSLSYIKHSIPKAMEMENLRRARLYWQKETYKEQEGKTFTDCLLDWDVEHNIRDREGNWIFSQKLFSVLAWLFNPKGNVTWDIIIEFMQENNLNSLMTLRDDGYKDLIPEIFIDKEKRAKAKKDAKDRKIKLEKQLKELEKLQNQETNFAIKSNIETTQELIAHFKEFMKEVFKKNKSLQSKFQNIPNEQKLKMFSVNK
mgnify:CR=1 FL=1